MSRTITLKDHLAAADADERTYQQKMKEFKCRRQARREARRSAKTTPAWRS